MFKLYNFYIILFKLCIIIKINIQQKLTNINNLQFSIKLKIQQLFNQNSKNKQKLIIYNKKMKSQKQQDLPPISLKLVLGNQKSDFNSNNNTPKNNKQTCQSPYSQNNSSFDSFHLQNNKKPKLQRCDTMEGIQLTPSPTKSKSKFNQKSDYSPSSQNSQIYNFDSIVTSQKNSQTSKQNESFSSSLSQSPVYQKLQQNIQYQPTKQDEITYKKEKLQQIYQNYLPYQKEILKEIDSQFKNNEAFVEQCTSFGVQQEFLKFFYSRYIEYCLGREDMNTKSLEFFRMSRQIYHNLIKITDNILEKENCVSRIDIIELLNQNSYLILPQSLVEYLGSNERIPEIFQKILYDLNTKQEFYLQDYVRKQYKMTEGEVLNLIKSLCKKDQELVKKLVKQMPSKASFTYPEFYIAKVIIWQSLQNYKYNPHIVNDIMEILEFYRYLIWQKKSQEFQEKQNNFIKIFSEKAQIPKLQKEDLRKFSKALIQEFYVDPDLHQAAQTLKQYIPSENLVPNYLFGYFHTQVSKIWEESQLDPFLLLDFRTKIRKCLYLLHIIPRPFDTKKSIQIQEESKIQVQKESQTIGSDLMNIHFIDIIQLIINFFYSSKNCYSVYDIIGAIRAYSLSKNAGSHINLILDLTFNATDLDQKIKQSCIFLIKQEIQDMENIQAKIQKYI